MLVGEKNGWVPALAQVELYRIQTILLKLPWVRVDGVGHVCCIMMTLIYTRDTSSTLRTFGKERILQSHSVSMFQHGKKTNHMSRGTTFISMYQFEKQCANIQVSPHGFIDLKTRMYEELKKTIGNRQQKCKVTKITPTPKGRLPTAHRP